MLVPLASLVLAVLSDCQQQRRRRRAAWASHAAEEAFVAGDLDLAAQLDVSYGAGWSCHTAPFAPHDVNPRYRILIRGRSRQEQKLLSSQVADRLGELTVRCYDSRADELMADISDPRGRSSLEDLHGAFDEHDVEVFDQATGQR